MKKILPVLSRVLKKITFSFGVIFIVMLIIAFTRLPYDGNRWLGDANSKFKFIPKTIILLGGSGMPSESNLIRLYYTARLSEIYDSSEIIISHPKDSSVAKSMRHFLIENGVDSSRISLMLRGTNTREQAMELIRFKKDIIDSGTVIVTSPENMYRTIRVFKKLSCKKMGGIPSYENAMFVDLKYNHKKLHGKKYIPDVSENLSFRYNFWNYFKLEITCLREYTAIVYYKLNGWI